MDLYKDDLCEYALAMRDELLKFPFWSEMLQQGETGNAVIKPQNQNGITTGISGKAIDNISPRV